MSFEYASVTKGLMLAIALTSIAAGIFDLKHYLNLQLVPHISKHHQYWRLAVHHLVCASSSDLLLTELVLYNVGILIERAFGGVKYASFLLISAVITVLVTFLALLVCQLTSVTRTLFNNIPPGPIAIMFASLYQYMRLVPPAYHFRVFGVGMSDKVWVYVIAVQLAITRLPASLLPTAVGLFVGYLYRSDYFLQLKAWRLSPKAVKIAEDWIKPLLGEGTQVRRTNRVLPEPRDQDQGAAQSRAANLGQDEVITTARNAQRRRPHLLPNPSTPQVSSTDGEAIEDVESNANANGGRGVVRQWMSELASGARPAPAPGAGTVRAPSEVEIGLLTGMFPNIDREVILGVLQRSANIEAAAETLLASQSTS